MKSLIYVCIGALSVGFILATAAEAGDTVVVKTPVVDKVKIDTYQKVDKPISVYENSRQTLFGNRTVNTTTVVTKPVLEKVDTKVVDAPAAAVCSDGSCSTVQSSSRMFWRSRSWRLFR